MQTLLSIIFFFSLTLSPPPPPTPLPLARKKMVAEIALAIIKMVVEIALAIIFQPLKVFPPVRNKNSGNYENPEITLRAKLITEDLNHMYYIN